MDSDGRIIEDLARVEWADDLLRFVRRWRQAQKRRAGLVAGDQLSARDGIAALIDIEVGGSPPRWPLRPRG